MSFNSIFMIFKKYNLDKTSLWLLIKMEKYLFGEITLLVNLAQEVLETKMNKFNWIILSDKESLISVVEIITVEL